MNKKPWKSKSAQVVIARSEATRQSLSQAATTIYAGSQQIAIVDISGNVLYYLNDHLGSARAIVDHEIFRSHIKRLGGPDIEREG